MALLMLQASTVMLQEQMTACNVAMSLKADRAQLSAIEATCSKLRAFEEHVERSKAQVAALEAAAAAARAELDGTVAPQLKGLREVSAWRGGWWWVRWWWSFWWWVRWW